MANQDNGSFVGGFTLGIFAGALGYFLFATDKGRRLKKELTQEWQAARANLPDRGEGLTNYQSLKDILWFIKQRIDESTAEAEQKLAHHKQTRRKTGPKKVSKFKGV